MNIKVNGTKELERELRRQVTKLSSIANKRLGRLKMRGYEDSPAYEAWERGGSIKFGVKGKSYDEVQAEYWRVKHFLDARTSTIRGANSYIKEIGHQLGIKGTIKELRNQSKTIFKLAEKIKEYDENIGNYAQALDYQKIFEQINVMIKDDEISENIAKQGLTDVDNIDRMLQYYLKRFAKS